jgi:hypothetical protein
VRPQSVDSARSGRSPSRAVEVDPLRRGLEKHVDRRPVGETTTLINPGAHISATEIHGIRARDVRHPPAFGDIAALPFARPLGGGVLHYLAALDLALADRLVTLAEADQLGELAQPMCLGAEELLDLHRSYLTALAAAAVADGVVTREVGTRIVGESACLQMLAAMEVAAATAVLVAPSQ